MIETISQVENSYFDQKILQLKKQGVFQHVGDFCLSVVLHYINICLLYSYDFNENIAEICCLNFASPTEM